MELKEICVRKLFFFLHFTPSSDQKMALQFLKQHHLFYPSRVYHTTGHFNRPWLWSDMCQCLCGVGSRHQRLQRWAFVIINACKKICICTRITWQKPLRVQFFCNFTHHVVSYLLFRGSLSDPFHEWGPAADPGGPRALCASSSYPVLHWGKLHDLLWQRTVLSLQCQWKTVGTHGGGGQH